MKRVNDEWDEGLFFDLRLLIRHPDIDPAKISEELLMTPQHWALAGSQRYTPTGTKLSGVHQRSFWGYSQRIVDRRYFFQDVMKMVHRLEPHRAFISDIIKTGGEVIIILHLAGTRNIGDDIESLDLHRMSDLGISLGIEVFPHMR